MTRLDPIHPSEILRHDFMEPLGLSATALAGAIGVTPARISEIVRARRGITEETALRLARFRHRCAELDEPPAELRARTRGAGQGCGARRHPSAPGGVSARRVPRYGPFDRLRAGSSACSG